MMEINILISVHSHVYRVLTKQIHTIQIETRGSHRVKVCRCFSHLRTYVVGNSKQTSEIDLIFGNSSNNGRFFQTISLILQTIKSLRSEIDDFIFVKTSYKKEKHTAFFIRDTIL